MSKLKKGLALVLTLCMMLSMLPVITPSAEATEGNDDFYKIVHLDCGRKYFTKDWIIALLHEMEADGFNQLQLAFGNDGLRFLLDDMSFTANGTTYSHDTVVSKVESGNKAQNSSGDSSWLKQSEMDEIISTANTLGIEIVPLLNLPGHANAILDIANDAYNYSTSQNTLDVTSEKAVNFAMAIFQKYVDYFAEKGCQFFNFGADEFANDISAASFSFGMMNASQYNSFISFINSMASYITEKHMTPRAFNDGLYYGKYTNVSINTDIQCCYWSSGWSGYNVASAATIAGKGHKMINTHGDFYYVLGKSDKFDSGSNYASNWDNKVFPGTTFTEEQTGGMFCIWCDYPNAETEDEIYTNVVTNGILSAMSEAMGHMPESGGSTDPEDTTVTDNGVSVTAPGLTGVTVTEKASATDIDGAAQGKVVSYDITPETSDGNYTGKAKVSLPIPSGWDTSRIYGYVKNADNTILKDIAGTVENNKFTFTVPHFSEVGLYEAEGTTDIEVTENEAITVTVGQTTTATISGANYAGTYTTDNPSIATVEVTGTDGQEGGVKYTEASATCNTLIRSNANSWTAVTGYYYKADDGNYYPVYAQRSSSGWLFKTYTYTWGYSTTSSTSNVTQIGTQSTTDTSTTPNITVYTKSDVAAVPASTTVTFTGVAVGTTYVTVGNTRYTINVEPKPVTPLTVEFWITNQKVTANGDTSMTIATSASGVYSESGAKFSDLVPATGTQGSNNMVFWKGTRLASDNKQTTDGGVDKTTSGTDFTYIRYWEGSWAYSADGQTWTNVVSGDQIVAYYLQKTEVTDEVTTQVVDWGPQQGNWSDLNYLGTKYVLLDYTVKYESGEETPSSFPNTNSLAFHCDTSTMSGRYYYRTLGMIRAEETADYEVYLITLTPTSDNPGTVLAGSAAANNSYKYNGTEVVAWAATQDDLNNSGLGTYTSISGKYTYSIGGDPIVSGLEIYRQHGLKVTYYVRAKATEDSLTVHYVDQTNNQDFYSYNIAVESGTLFNEDISLADSWKAPLDNGTVTNSLGKTQTVSADLNTLPEIGAQYRYSDYTCVKVERSENGKDVYLYYTFSNTHNFVIDFGLPLKITTSDLGISGNWTSASVSGAKYGTATATVGGGVTYTPTQTLKGVETLQLTLTDGTDGVTHTIYIYPATTVYYEEGFATYEGNWTSTGNTGSGEQQTAKAGQVANATAANYGYDAAYVPENYVGPSNGTQATSSAPDGTKNYATFTFTGTGVDVYANCTTQDAKLMIGVYQGTQTNSPLQVISVNTKMANGSEAATEGQAVRAYNVPVASITGLDYGEYTLKIIHVKVNNSTTGSAVNLDGFRVYGTLEDQNNEVYRSDLEDNPTFIELRDEVLTAQNVSTADSKYADQIAKSVYSQVFNSSTETTKGAIILSGNTSYDDVALKDLLENGPKNEIYLWKDQSLTFKITGDNAKRVVQVGLKALDKATAYSINNENAQPLNSSTDMFYTVVKNNPDRTEQLVTITNNGDGILSITKLKICDDPNATLGTLTAEDLIPALVSLGFKAPEGEEGSSGTDTPTTPPTTDPGAETPTTPADPATGLPFTDVGPGDWFLENVKYVYEKGLMNGTSDTTFSPKKTTNRAMIVTILHRLEGTPAPGAPAPFTDVPAGQYYAEAVAWAAANSIVNGTSETTYAPLNNITREQMAAILYRYAQYKNYDVSGSADLSAFTDAASISDYAVSALQWAVDAGLINGKGNGILDPKGSATRAEVSAILSRFCENIAG